MHSTHLYRLQIPPASHRHFSSLARRLGRIFAHAYFHHREAFEQAEAESSLYARFLALTSKFELVPSEFLVIPQRPLNDTDDDLPRDAQMPRPLGASMDSFSQARPTPPAGEDEKGQEHDRDLWSRTLGTAGNNERGTSPGSGRESPRKVGRSRTDTMVLQEGFAFAEELARAESSKGVDDSAKPLSILLEPPSNEHTETQEGAPTTAKLAPQAERAVVGDRPPKAAVCCRADADHPRDTEEWGDWVGVGQSPPQQVGDEPSKAEVCCRPLCSSDLIS